MSSRSDGVEFSTAASACVGLSAFPDVEFSTEMRLALATLDGPALRVRIQTLEVDLAELRRQQRDLDDARFLRALLLGTHGAVFNLADLRVRAKLDPDLRDALGELRPRQLGQRLHRLTGRVCDGLCVVRAKRDQAGCNWQVQLA